MKLFLCLLLTAALLLFMEAPAANAMAKGTRTVRVAFPIQTGLTQLDEYGNYSGYTYEYLEEIAQYTGWNYEFVEVSGDPNESLLTLMDMLEKGEIDLMGGMLYSEELGQQYDYASYSYGSVETILRCFTIPRRILPSIRRRPRPSALPLPARADSVNRSWKIIVK